LYKTSELLFPVASMFQYHHLHLCLMSVNDSYKLLTHKIIYDI